MEFHVQIKASYMKVVHNKPRPGFSCEILTRKRVTILFLAFPVGLAGLSQEEMFPSFYRHLGNGQKQLTCFVSAFRQRVGDVGKVSVRHSASR